MLTRTSVVLGMATVMLVILAGAAAADPWGDVDCEQIPSPSCDLGAGTGEDAQPGRPPSNPDQPRGGRGGSPDVPQLPQGDVIAGEPENLADCEYLPVDYVPPGADRPPIIEAGGPAGSSPEFVLAAFTPSVVQAAVVPPDGGEGGSWYVYRCSSEGFRDALWRPPVWIPDEEAPDGTVGPSVVDVAQQAYNQLRLGSPLIGVSPAAEQLVHLPTWLWLDPADWAEVSATASVPGVSVTAVATPQSVSWSTGDGGAVTCEGPGTPFTAGDDPASESPDCGYTYTAPSAGEPGEMYELSATVTWTVTWSGAGQSGVFPGLTTNAATQVRVVESHGLNTQ